MKITPNAEIERTAATRLAEYERQFGRISEAPVPIELIVGQLFRLTVEWDEIQEVPGECTLGGISPERRVIVLNLAHVDLFEKKPGLERFTIGHEAGHWEFHVDKGAIGQPKLFDGVGEQFFRRSSGSGEVLVSRSNEELLSILEATQRKDSSEEERVVNRFSAALLMPPQLVATAIAGIEWREWHQLYSLAEQFGVTPSAMRVRLDQLGHLYIDGQGRFHRSRQEAEGQLSLF